MAISQAEFARRRNVSRPRVNQWIKSGKIFGPALVDGGIDEAVACEQLKVKLSIDQRLSGNGLATNLEAAAAAPRDLELPLADTVEKQIALERLIGLQRSNREKATDESLRLGALCDTAAARAQTTREVNQAIIRIEGMLPGIASALSSQFKLIERDVLHLLRSEWRKARQGAAIEARERAEPMPEIVGFDLAES